MGKGFRSCWRKSSLSVNNGNCVEVARLPDGEIGVRDSKDPEGSRLTFTPEEWHSFLGGVRNGEFDSFSRKPPADSGPGCPDSPTGGPTETEGSADTLAVHPFSARR